jgi:hypothetical protein
VDRLALWSVGPVEDLLERLTLVRIDGKATTQPLGVDVEVVGLPEVDLGQVLVQVEGEVVENRILGVARDRGCGLELLGVDALAALLGELELARAQAGAVVVDRRLVPACAFAAAEAQEGLEVIRLLDELRVRGRRQSG